MKRKLQNWLLKKLFCVITLDDVIQVKKDKTLWIGKKQIPQAKARQLIAEAMQINQLELWKFMRNNMRYLANQEMFNKAKTIEDILAGKMMLYTLQLQENLLNALLSAIPEKAKEDKSQVSSSPKNPETGKTPEKSGANK